jgi:hypothetical protein
MVHVRPPCSHYWHLSICPTIAPMLVSQWRKNQCQVSFATRRWQLESCWRQLHFNCQLGASQGIQRDGNHWAPCCQLNLWLVILLHLGGYGHPPTIPVLCPETSTSLDCFRSTHQATDLLQMQRWSTLSTPVWDTWHQFMVCWDTSLGATVGQMVKCEWWPHGCLMSTTCYDVPCMHWSWNTGLTTSVTPLNTVWAIY